MRSTVTLLVILFAGASDAGAGQPARNVPVLVEASRLDLAVRELSRSLQIPTGLELKAAAPATETKPKPEVRPARVPMLNFQNLGVADAMRHIYRHHPDFEHRMIDDVVVVRPKGQHQFPASWLNRVIEKFEIVDLAPREALHAVHRLFDPGYVMPPVPPSALKEMASREGMRKPLTVRLENATVIQILNAIARAHGRLNWVVHYHRDQAVAEEASIGVSSWDNWSITTTARSPERRVLRQPTAPARVRPPGRPQ